MADSAVFAELNPPYSTIVADPPWHYEQGGPSPNHVSPGVRSRATVPVKAPPYSMMSVEDIRRLPVESLVGGNAHLYLWTTSRYLRSAHDIAEVWGFRHSQTLTWCKQPRGIGPGGAFASTTEFVLFCVRGSLAYRERIATSWWTWPRGRHSEKPPGFLDLVEQVSPGPYVELFARQPRLGWDSWGKGHEVAA